MANHYGILKCYLQQVQEHQGHQHHHPYRKRPIVKYKKTIE